MTHVTTTVMREGVAREIPISHLVPGDIVRLAAGDMIPADIRILSCKDLFVVQSSLTKELSGDILKRRREKLKEK